MSSCNLEATPRRETPYSKRFLDPLPQRHSVLSDVTALQQKLFKDSKLQLQLGYIRRAQMADEKEVDQWKLTLEARVSHGLLGR